MSRLKFRAPLACKIAGIDRDRFNEAVSRKEYPCAPDTTPGQTRLFTEDGIIGLYIYGHLLRRGVSSEKAGHLACKIAEQLWSLKGHEDKLSVSIIRTRDNFYALLTANLGATEREDLQRETRQLVVSPNARAMDLGHLGDLVISQENWPIANIRTLIQHEIEEYRNTLGEEETLG